MPLRRGDRLGVYEVIEPVGAGGMGEVYRARDTTLGRDVAIKVLPDRLMDDSSRRTRFEREARLLAQLHHPHIAVVYGFETRDSVSYLAMEFVAGQTLDVVLERGPLPPEQVVDLFAQLGDALAAAHERGVIHRDLKPSNLKIDAAGAVKVLDFGLAKALNDEPSSAGTTMLTQDGAIVGTAPYMSPEQASGRFVDKRTDIWALGCVLYEALTGRRTFSGDSSADVIASILRSEPDWSLLPATTPPRLRRTIERCLRKDPAARWRDVSDLVLAFDEAADLAPLQKGDAPRRWIPRAATAAGLVSVGVLLAVLVLQGLRSGEGRGEPSLPGAFDLTLPRDMSLNLTYGSIAMSPDGRTIVFAGTAGGRTQLYRRDLGSFTTEPVGGPVSGRTLFFSPDGRWIGGFGFTHMYKVPVAGGPAVKLCETDVRARGAAWLPHGVIVFNPGTRGGLTQTSDAACTAEKVSSLDNAGAPDQRWPAPMPDGVLYTAIPQEGGTPRILALDLQTKQHQVVTEGAFARFVAPSSLFFVRGPLESGTAQLFVAPFDPKMRRLTGTAEVIAEGVGVSADGLAHYAVSDRDHLVYAPPVQGALRVVDGSGVVHVTIPLKEAVDMMHLSADGRRAVLAMGSQLQVVDLERGVMERITYEPGRYKFPVWSPDGRRILYRYQRPDGGPYQIMILDLGTAAAPEAVTEVHANPETGGASTWTPDGGTIAGNEHKPGKQDQDLWIMRLGGDGRRLPLAAGPFVEVNGRISPNGRMIAFISTESGGFDVFVRPFEGGARRRVSPAGGYDPIWHPNGRELFYRVGNRISSAAIAFSAGGIQVGVPRTIVDRPLRGGGLWQYGVMPDGRPVTMEEAEPVSTLRVLVNWRQMVEARQRRNAP